MSSTQSAWLLGWPLQISAVGDCGGVPGDAARADGEPGTRGARLRVEASGGCFRWISQRPDLVALEEPLPEELPPRRAAEAEAEAACQEAPARRYGAAAIAELHCELVRHACTWDASSLCKRIQAQLVMAAAWRQPVAIIRSLAESVENVEKVLVLAQDIHSSGVELRCEVYIANIHRIEVETSVRRINVDDVETLGVKAYDKQGNVFSSLEGLQSLP
ncbi:GB210 [Symbiodinium sp. CCMP2592]|nr:GB210 [Symbiodinium sp. CCMP2592]